MQGMSACKNVNYFYTLAMYKQKLKLKFIISFVIAPKIKYFCTNLTTVLDIQNLHAKTTKH